MGGGNERRPRPRLGGVGLSPRGRGKLELYPDDDARERSIPAWAGETNPRRRRCHIDEVYPRVGGGNSLARSNLARVSGLSPRGRGKREAEYRYSQPYRSIPAWAGETYYQTGSSTMSEVYPRVGGGNAAIVLCVMSRLGLSPRGRGKQYLPDVEIQRLAVYPRVGGGNRVRDTDSQQ